MLFNGEKERTQVIDKTSVKSAIEGRTNESHTTQTMPVVHQLTSDCGDGQQNPNSLANQSALTIVSVILENES